MSDLGEVPKAEGVTVKIDNESRNDLLSSEMNAQLIRPKFFPHASQFSRRESFRGGDRIYFFVDLSNNLTAQSKKVCLS